MVLASVQAPTAMIPTGPASSPPTFFLGFRILHP